MSELKERALLERIGQLTMAYEDKIADLRVDLTNITDHFEALRASIKPESNAPGTGQVIEGTVVQ